ncbi:isocitrate/isopropylmalate dehydrogenase family protein [Nocardioides marmotae]|uniref:isocitrate/isopropylmalate dehydrogenase family protein n=1 Tax=Nocardioides marmotae TaxID=2663857 RepID=UPI0012B59957|nr:isocitrate/isopropylmalate family dehydrogenase [Nocardioides marmotae]MBC9732805.1 isocitrate/isopropylmalate dehydrogenase family protein [Nocardioides marmotae]MTB83919.1 isocitrate/isopropylmalate dehydrogenase family protein [Nocardioides marmotae]
MAQQSFDIAVLPGDGIGPEVVAAAQDVIDQATSAAGVGIRWTEHEGGAQYYLDHGEGIAEKTVEAAGRADAVLLGAMGLPWVRDRTGVEITPQIDLRERFDLFASLRPARLLPKVEGPLRRGRVDLLVIRETTEGLFAGRHDHHPADHGRASDRLTITRAGSDRLFEVAFAQAALRRERGGPGRVTLFDKANVLRSMAFMREVFDEVAARHPDIETERLYVDAGCMFLVTDPDRFDVVVTENQFGDIASEVAAGVSGGLGVAPSADIGLDHAVFQPCHGTAPDLAGRGLANPVAALLSGAMMLDWLGQRHANTAARRAAAAIEDAVAHACRTGVRTPDLGGRASTSAVSDAVASAALRILQGTDDTQET